MNFPNEKETQRDVTAQRSQARPRHRWGHPTIGGEFRRSGPCPLLLLLPNQQADYNKLISLHWLDSRAEPSLCFFFLHFAQKVLSKSLGSLSVWELSIGDLSTRYGKAYGIFSSHLMPATYPQLHSAVIGATEELCVIHTEVTGTHNMTVSLHNFKWDLKKG